MYGYVSAAFALLQPGTGGRQGGQRGRQRRASRDECAADANAAEAGVITGARIGLNAADAGGVVSVPQDSTRAV